MKKAFRPAFLIFVAVLAGCALLCGVALPSAQGQNCTYVHPLVPAPVGFHVVELPAAALAAPDDRNVSLSSFERASPGYPPNLRFYARNSSGDTSQIPFVVDDLATLPQARSLPQQNLGRVGNATRLTVELADRPLLDRLHLELDNANFEGRVLLEGADVPGDWQMLVDQARILDVSRADADYRFTDVNFAPTRFRYYRLTISGIQKLNVREVQAQQPSSRQLRQAYASHWRVLAKAPSSRETQVLLQLPEHRLIDQVRVFAHAKVPFERPVEVGMVVDSIRGGDGRTRYRTLNRGIGVLASTRLDDVMLAGSVGDLLLVTIYDGDDQPLAIDSVVASGPRRFATVRFPESGAASSVWLGYGCAVLGLPDFDLARQQALIPEGLDTLAVGPQSNQVATKDSVKGLQLSSWALWAALLAVGIVIVVVAVRLLRVEAVVKEEEVVEP